MSKTVYFDFETGGVEPHHPSIQLAAIVIDDSTGKELAYLEQKIKFAEADCDPEALKINHYRTEDWVDAVSPEQTAARFSAFIGPHRSIQMTSKRTGNPYNVAKLAGYNALTFDLPRLKALFADQFFPCSYQVRDVLQRAMFWFDERPTVAKPKSLKLSVVCDHFGITVDGAHDALVDVRLTAALAKKLRDGYADLPQT